MEKQAVRHDPDSDYGIKNLKTLDKAGNLPLVDFSPIIVNMTPGQPIQNLMNYADDLSLGVLDYYVENMVFD